MTIIDWAYAGAHFLWIFGLALILAAFSYHVWLGQETRRRLSEQLQERSFRLTVFLGIALMTVSITVMPRSERWFTRLAALLVALMFASAGLRVWWRNGPSRNS